MSVLPVGFSGSGDYTIEESLRFNASQSSYLNRTPASATNRKTWTWSGWVKRGTLGVTQWLFDADNGSTDSTEFNFAIGSGDTLSVGGSVTTWRTTTQVFRDPSAWYHIVLAIDTTQATANNRIRLYVNGLEITTFSTLNNPTQNLDLAVNQAIAHYIGIRTGLTSPLNSYLTEVNFIDGQALTPSSFGEFDNTTGVWKPKQYVGTYGTNGFFLNFSDATSATTLGYDYSGNANNWTLNSFNTTPTNALYCSMTDTPTPYLGGGNYAVLNPLDVSSVAFTNGNLTGTAPSAHVGSRATMALPTTGKYYWEATTNSNVTGGNEFLCGVANSTTSLTAWLPSSVWGGYGPGGPNVFSNTAWVATYSPMPSMVAGVVWQIAYDAATQNIWIGYNNVWYTSAGANTGSPSAGTGQTATASGTVYPYFEAFNLVFNVNFGQRPFAYTPPTGFLPLNTNNLPNSTIVDGSKHFDAVLYTGNGGSQSITSLEFQPDFSWFKERSAAEDHVLYDSIRGAGYILHSNDTNAELNNVGFNLDSWTANGFNLVLGNQVNENTQTYVAWNWKANGAGVSNTAGTITSTVSANPTAGFSIVSYTGTGANATVGHGLGVAPKWVIVKGRSGVGDWKVYTETTGNTTQGFLNDSLAFQGSSPTLWNSTSPTSTVFSIGTNSNVNTNTATYVAYCFAPVPGYSAFGSYTGNGSADGPFVYLGFRPKFVLLKSSGTTEQWWIHNSETATYNPIGPWLYANLSNAEQNGPRIDFVSNGFKIRGAFDSHNASAINYIYMAFAESPFKVSLAR